MIIRGQWIVLQGWRFGDCLCNGKKRANAVRLCNVVKKCFNLDTRRKAGRNFFGGWALRSNNGQAARGTAKCRPWRDFEMLVRHVAGG
jgi:hypothetical protein